MLARVTGRYRDGARELTVRLDGERLALQGVLWPSNALLPITEAIFDVEAWPFQVHFEENALHWQGPRLSWGGPHGVYQREASESP